MILSPFKTHSIYQNSYLSYTTTFRVLQTNLAFLQQNFLINFDVHVFSETWLHAGLQTTDLLVPNFKPPERKDRARGHQGGVMIYAKNMVHYTRRNDLEPLNIECIWIEMQLKQTSILLGLFYRPSTSDALYLSAIEDSISLALDTQK